MRDWGASRAGLYAFVSPVIAVAVGVALAGETLHASDLAGMVIMLAATGFAMGRAPAVAGAGPVGRGVSRCISPPPTASGGI